MKVRHIKHHRLSLMAGAAFMHASVTKFNDFAHAVAERCAPAGQFDALLSEVLPPVKEVVQVIKPQEFIVVRKKDGVEIGTFTSLEAAQAEIDKAKRSKKAALALA